VTPTDEARAARLWPNNEYLQREWLRAVQLVRATNRGWVAESHLKGAGSA